MAGRPTAAQAALHAMTSEQIAAQIGIASQKVRLGEQKALRKLRELFAGQEMEDFMPQECVCTGRWNGKKIVRMR